VTITREQVADLCSGDVVEYSGHPDLKGAKVVGPLHESDGSLFIADYVVRNSDGSTARYRNEELTLAVVSRALRPLYVNHDRTEGVPGDVVRDEDGVVWLRDRYGKWVSVDSETDDDHLLNWTTGTLTLLVDGETGETVPAVQS
jgi:hypothetical protein